MRRVVAGVSWLMAWPVCRQLLRRIASKIGFIDAI
jgi:hypothetical protein